MERTLAGAHSRRIEPLARESLGLTVVLHAPAVACGGPADMVTPNCAFIPHRSLNTANCTSQGTRARPSETMRGCVTGHWSWSNSVGHERQSQRVTGQWSNSARHERRTARHWSIVNRQITRGPENQSQHVTLTCCWSMVNQLVSPERARRGADHIGPSFDHGSTTV